MKLQLFKYYSIINQKFFNFSFTEPAKQIHTYHPPGTLDIDMVEVFLCSLVIQQLRKVHEDSNSNDSSCHFWNRFLFYISVGVTPGLHKRKGADMEGTKPPRVCREKVSLICWSPRQNGQSLPRSFFASLHTAHNCCSSLRLANEAAQQFFSVPTMAPILPKTRKNHSKGGYKRNQ